MSSDDLLATLEEKINTLLNDNELLRQQVEQLQDANNRQRQEMIRTHAELNTLRQDYKYLRMAHALLTESPERDIVRRQLTNMIHLVDKALDNLKAVEADNPILTPSEEDDLQPKSNSDDNLI